MKHLCTVEASMVHVQGLVKVVQWTAADPFPKLGPSVGVDTETEKITDTCLAPKVVVLGCFDKASMTCYVVYWRDIPAFMRELCSRDIEQRYFNLGFDEMVIDNEDPDKALMTAIDQGCVRDMQIRIHLHELSTLGYVRFNLHTLKDCTLMYEKYELDKGDGTDASARLSFRRFNADGSDYVITDEQARYLPFDCIATWALGEAIPEMATEVAHTKGMCVLAHISANGLTVDKDVVAYMKDKLAKDKEGYRKKLVGFGFPDPAIDYPGDLKTVSEAIPAVFKRFLGLNDVSSPVSFSLTKTQMRLIIVYCYCHETFPEELQDCARDVRNLLLYPRKNMNPQERSLFNKLLEDYEFLSVDTASRDIVMSAFVWKLIDSYSDQLESGAAAVKGYDFKQAVEHANDYIDDHPHWFAKNAGKVGPRKFFQQYVQGILDRNPGLELEKTEKSGEIKLTLKDTWRLSDMGIKDDFLDAYTKYNHCQKYESTYLKPEYIKADGCVHPRYLNLLRTGRTSCSNPNVQQLPSRDGEYALKLMYRAPEGMVLCSTDYSFIELCSFAQSCYTRFGVSVMREVINAGLDPHRWFAGVMNKVISPDLSNAHDPKWVSDISAYLKEHITSTQRSQAKMANFGFGAMCA